MNSVRLLPSDNLIHDRDAVYGGDFDLQLASLGVTGVRTPPRAPTANSIAERIVLTIRTECLDHLIVIDERHLRAPLGEFADYYNRDRPHRSLGLQSPLPSSVRARGRVVSRLPLAQHDQVVETLPPEGPHHTLGDGIRPRCHHWRADPACAKPPDPRVEVDAIDPIAVMNQIARLLAVRGGVEQLLPDPGHRWVLGDIEMDQVTAGMLDEKQHIERLEGQGLHHEQVRGPRSL